MHWTNNKPTEPGFWWYDPEDASEFNPPNVRHVYQLAYGDDKRLWLQGEPLEDFTARGRWGSEKIAMPHEPLPPPCPGCGRHKPHCDCPEGMYASPAPVESRGLHCCFTCESAAMADGRIPFFDRRFIVCPICGNKRCPKATHHDNACTGSNESGQTGSRFQ